MGCMEIESARHHHHRSRSPIRGTICVRTMGPRAPPIPPASSRRFRLLAPTHLQRFLIWLLGHAELLGFAPCTPESVWNAAAPFKPFSFPVRLACRLGSNQSMRASHCAEGQSFHFASIRKEHANVRRVTQVRAWNQKNQKTIFPNRIFGLRFKGCCYSKSFFWFSKFFCFSLFFLFFWFFEFMTSTNTKKTTKKMVFVTKRVKTTKKLRKKCFLKNKSTK